MTLSQKQTFVANGAISSLWSCVKIIGGKFTVNLPENYNHNEWQTIVKAEQKLGKTATKEGRNKRDYEWKSTCRWYLNLRYYFLMSISFTVGSYDEPFWIIQ